MQPCADWPLVQFDRLPQSVSYSRTSGARYKRTQPYTQSWTCIQVRTLKGQFVSLRVGGRS